MTYIKKTFSVISKCLIAVLLVTAIYTAISQLTNNVPTFFGYGVVKIISPSMEPTIMTGDYILIKKASPDEIKEGDDIITFFSSDPLIRGKLNTHRVAKINPDGSFTTKGDNPVTNPDNDRYKVMPGDLFGKYVRTLPLITLIGRILMNPAVFLPLVILSGLYLLICSIIDIIKRKPEPDERTVQKTTDQLIMEEIERLIAADAEKNKSNSERKDK